MNVKEMIQALREMGYEVSARKRTDGGYIITKINGETFTGAKGNTYARNILGEPLSFKRAEQTAFNVNKYIKKPALDKELKKGIQKVQRIWRKREVHARITTKKLRWHLQAGGRREAEEYLAKMSRYGQGYAYQENVEYLANYIENVSLGITDNELKEAVVKTAEFVRSKVETFKEEWIAKVYAYWYEVIESHYDNNVVSQAIMKTYSTIG